MNLNYFLLLIPMVVGNVAYADDVSNEKWEGTYTYDDSGMNATETRSFMSRYCLNVYAYDGVIYADKRFVDNGDVSAIMERYEGSSTNDKLTLNYQSCIDMDSRMECEQETHQRGEPMLILERVTEENKEVFKPTWLGLKAFNYSEDSNKLFFIKEDLDCADGYADGDAEMERELSETPEDSAESMTKK